jgi:amino acid transporter
MLFYFRKVYQEVVTAIPVNGGTYNILLNTVSKKIASFVGVMSFLAYVATGIVSAFDAVIYLSVIWPSVNIRLMTVIVLLTFGTITVSGVKDSSFITCTMFVIHMSVLTILILWGLLFGIYHDQFGLFVRNLRTPVPTIRSAHGPILGNRNPAAAIYFGYASGLLGITGFESASNYVEEMNNSEVFVSTVNWMW